MGERENTPAIAFVALVTGCVLWGSGAAVGKIALSVYNPIFLVIMRLILAFVVFTPVVIWRFWPIRLPNGLIQACRAAVVSAACSMAHYLRAVLPRRWVFCLAYLAIL